ncbi:hypothetical protein KSP40_PGU002528 [Platanthera guangdongensis]|uniref:Uncharacterized protein n=1 Tax=Platanthera guangdongensis TaxID=2320717 RepID=A0ABR2LFZ1_9ASPA
MHADRVCVVKIQIGDREFDFLALVLPLVDFDVIFGIDWLSEQGVYIDCNRKEVKLGLNTDRETTFAGMKGSGKIFVGVTMVI